MKLVTVHVYPPIPIRDWDWCVYDSDVYDGAPDAGPQMVGWGKTEDEAKADFREQWVLRESERDCNRAIENMKVFDDMFSKVFGFSL